MQARYPYNRYAFLNTLNRLPQPERYDFIQRNAANMRALCTTNDMQYHMEFVDVLKKLDIYGDSRRVAAGNRDLITHHNISNVLEELHPADRAQFVKDQEEFWHNLYLRQQNRFNIEASDHNSDDSSSTASQEKREREEDQQEMQSQRPQKKAAVVNQGMFGSRKAIRLAELQKEADEFIARDHMIEARRRDI